MTKEYTPMELAKMLSVSVKTVNNYLNNGMLVGYKIGGRWRIPWQSIKEFLQLSNIKYLGGNEND